MEHVRAARRLAQLDLQPGRPAGRAPGRRQTLRRCRRPRPERPAREDEACAAALAKPVTAAVLFGGDTIPGSEIERRAACAAAGLEAAGVAEDSTVAVMLRN